MSISGKTFILRSNGDQKLMLERNGVDWKKFDNATNNRVAILAGQSPAICHHVHTGRQSGSTKCQMSDWVDMAFSLATLQTRKPKTMLSHGCPFNLHAGKLHMDNGDVDVQLSILTALFAKARSWREWWQITAACMGESSTRPPSKIVIVLRVNFFADLD